MRVNSDPTNFKYTCKESEITSNYEWLYQTEVSFRANVKLWEPANNTLLCDRNYTSIRTDHKLYKRWLDATNCF